MFGLRLDDSGVSLLAARVNMRGGGPVADGSGFRAAIHTAETVASLISEVTQRVPDALGTQEKVPDTPQGSPRENDRDTDASSDQSRPNELWDVAVTAGLEMLPEDIAEEAKRLRGAAPVRQSHATSDPRYALLASQWAIEGTDDHPETLARSVTALPDKDGLRAPANSAIHRQNDVQPVASQLRLSVPDPRVHAELPIGTLPDVPREARSVGKKPIGWLAAEVGGASRWFADSMAKSDHDLTLKNTTSDAVVQAVLAHNSRAGGGLKPAPNTVQYDDVPPQDGTGLQGKGSAALAAVNASGAILQNTFELGGRVREMHTGDAALPSVQAMPGQAGLRAHTSVPPQLPHLTGEMFQEQMLTALRKPAPNTVHIQLDPIELGRVRISLQAGENGLQVHVMTERPETLDLLRRFSVDLLRDLSQMGYKDLSMSFSDQRESEKPFKLPADSPDSSAPERATISDTSQLVPGADQDGVDIRV